MEPAFYRGDILTLTMPEDKLDVGDIIVFKIKGRDIPIIHRVIEAHYPE
jgi:signal peptidase